MKALSVKQPWAWAIIVGGKPLENRDWRYPPKYRGPLLIHASKTFDDEGYKWILENASDLGLYPEDIPEKKDFQRGGVIGKADLTGVVTEHISRWFFGSLGLVMENQDSLPFIPCKGALGLFEVPDDLLKLHGVNI